MNKAEFLVILVITVIVFLIWGASNFIHSRSAAIPNPDAKQYLDPVDPNFDKGTLDKISSLSVATHSATALPLPSPSPSPKSATPSATPKTKASPTASPKVSPSPSASSIFP